MHLSFLSPCLSGIPQHQIRFCLSPAAHTSHTSHTSHVPHVSHVLHVSPVPSSFYTLVWILRSSGLSFLLSDLLPSSVRTHSKALSSNYEIAYAALFPFFSSPFFTRQMSLFQGRAKRAKKAETESFPAQISSTLSLCVLSFSFRA